MDPMMAIATERDLGGWTAPRMGMYSAGRKDLSAAVYSAARMASAAAASLVHGKEQTAAVQKELDKVAERAVSKAVEEAVKKVLSWAVYSVDEKGDGSVGGSVALTESTGGVYLAGPAAVHSVVDLDGETAAWSAVDWESPPTAARKASSSAGWKGASEETGKAVARAT